MKENARSGRKLDAAIARIEEMEQCFCALVAAGAEAVVRDAALAARLEALKAYYEGGQWLSDYALDEAGLLPPGMSRGVLSEDAVYNFLTDVDNAAR